MEPAMVPEAPGPPRSNHKWAKARFTTPKKCDECRKKIWSLNKSALSCTECGIVIHKKCIQHLVISDCKGEGRKPLHHNVHSVLGRPNLSLKKSGDPFVSTQNLLAASQDGNSLFVGWGAKLKRLLIRTVMEKVILESQGSLKTIPGCKLRNLIVDALPLNDGTSVEILITMSSLGVCVFKTAKMEETPLVLGLGTSFVCMTYRNGYLACANESSEINVWNIAKEFEKKSSSEETLLLDSPAVDISFAKDDGSCLIALCSDGKLRVFSLGLVRCCLSEQDLYAPNTVASIVNLPRVTLAVDNGDSVRVFDSEKLLRLSSTSINADRFSTVIQKKTAESSELCKHTLLRIPLAGSSLVQPRVYLDFVDELSMIITCTAQSGQLDLMRLTLDDVVSIKSVSSLHHPCVVQGFCVSSASDFVRIFTFMDNHEIMCLSLNKAEQIKSSGVGPSARAPVPVAPISLSLLPPLSVAKPRQVSQHRKSRMRTRSDVRQVISLAETSSSSSSGSLPPSSAPSESLFSASPTALDLNDGDDEIPVSFSAPERDRGLLAAIEAREDADEAADILPPASADVPTLPEISVSPPEDKNDETSSNSSNQSRMLRAGKKSVSTLNLVPRPGPDAMGHYRSRSGAASNETLPQLKRNPTPPSPWRGAALPAQASLRNVKPDAQL